MGALYNDLSVYDAFGILGVALYLGAYGALQLGFLRGQGYLYAGLNAIAAGLVLLGLRDAFNLSSAVIQVSWIVISVVGIARYYYLTHRTRFNDEEQSFIDTVLHGLDRIKARRLIDLGSWISGEAGTVLTEAGKPVDNLIYLAEGRAVVAIDDTVIATLNDKSLIGEMTAMSGQPASATVMISEPSRYLAIPVQPLRELLERDDEIRRHVQLSFTDQVSSKLVGANTLMAAGRQRS